MQETQSISEHVGSQNIVSAPRTCLFQLLARPKRYSVVNCQTRTCLLENKTVPMSTFPEDAWTKPIAGRTWFTVLDFKGARNVFSATVGDGKWRKHFIKLCISI